jgi:hypothetical protein
MISNDQALVAVARMGGIRFFPSGDIERMEIAKILCAMVNWPPEKILRRYDTYPPSIIPYVEPEARLEWLVQTMNNHVSEWCGIAEMRAIFDKKFRSADGVKPNGCTVPGFTDDECESGCDVLSLSRAEARDQAYLPQPGDEPIGDEFKNLIAATVEKKRIG